MVTKCYNIKAGEISTFKFKLIIDTIRGFYNIKDLLLDNEIIKEIVAAPSISKLKTAATTIITTFKNIK